MSTPMQLKYAVVTSNSPDDLAMQVTQYLSQGWQLRGDLILFVLPGEAVALLYVQVLVR